MKLLTTAVLFVSMSVASGFAVTSNTIDSHRRTTGFAFKSGAYPAVRDQNTRLQAFDGALSTLDHFYQTSPYLAGLLTCSCKASAADWFAQSRQSSEANIKRNLAFITYGGLYQGVCQTFIFSVLFPALFPEHTLQNTLSQVAIDVLLLGPFVCMPTVYTLKAVLNGEEKTAGIAKYINHVQNKGILFKYWGIWAPVQALNFGVVPPHLRVLFVAMVSFFWTCLLSTVSSSDSEEATVVQQQQKMPQPPLPVPVLSDMFDRHQQLQQYEQLQAEQYYVRSPLS